MVCPFLGCEQKYRIPRKFWEHIVNIHLYSKLLPNILSGSDIVTKCPFEGCKFESRAESEQKRCMLNHYSIVHKVVNEIFTKMFPDHYYAQKS